MPSRIIRDSCRTSESLARLTDSAERLFWRLVTVAEDFGRFEADPVLVRAACFPRMLDQVSIEQTASRLSELGQEHVVLYEVGGKRYGSFLNWDKHQRRRASKSKFPPPPTSAVKRCQLRANVARKRDRDRDRDRGIDQDLPPTRRRQQNEPIQPSESADELGQARSPKGGPRPTQEPGERARRDRTARARLAEESRHRSESAVGSTTPPRAPVPGSLSPRALERRTPPIGFLDTKMPPLLDEDAPHATATEASAGEISEDLVRDVRDLAPLLGHEPEAVLSAHAGDPAGLGAYVQRAREIAGRRQRLKT